MLDNPSLLEVSLHSRYCYRLSSPGRHRNCWPLSQRRLLAARQLPIQSIIFLITTLSGHKLISQPRSQLRSSQAAGLAKSQRREILKGRPCGVQRLDNISTCTVSVVLTANSAVFVSAGAPCNCQLMIQTGHDNQLSLNCWRPPYNKYVLVPEIECYWRLILMQCTGAAMTGEMEQSCWSRSHILFEACFGETWRNLPLSLCVFCFLLANEVINLWRATINLIKCCKVWRLLSQFRNLS